MTRALLLLFLKNFWRLVLATFALGLGLLWAVFGLGKTVVILAVVLLGYFLGKWIDEGGPPRDVRRYFD